MPKYQVSINLMVTATTIAEANSILFSTVMPKLREQGYKPTYYISSAVPPRNLCECSFLQPSEKTSCKYC